MAMHDHIDSNFCINEIGFLILNNDWKKVN